jgi:hypothetical protein
VTTFRIDANSDFVQGALRDDTRTRHLQSTLKGRELVKLSQRLARPLKGRCTLAKIVDVELLEYIHTLITIRIALERVAAEILEHGVKHDYCAVDDTLQGLRLSLGILGSDDLAANRFTITVVQGKITILTFRSL